jgi:rifampicin phosphotransferase
MLATAVERLGSDRLAVRSSGVDEDLPGASYAGQTFDDYQREFAFRALNYELAEPSLGETPELTLGLLADQVARNYDPDAEAAALAERRKAAQKEARTALAGRPSADRERFERALARAERAYPVREDNEFFTYSVPLCTDPVSAPGDRAWPRGARAALPCRRHLFLTWEEAR